MASSVMANFASLFPTNTQRPTVPDRVIKRELTLTVHFDNWLGVLARYTLLDGLNWRSLDGVRNGLPWLGEEKMRLNLVGYVIDAVSFSNGSDGTCKLSMS